MVANSLRTANGPPKKCGAYWNLTMRLVVEIPLFTRLYTSQVCVLRISEPSTVPRNHAWHVFVFFWNPQKGDHDSLRIQVCPKKGISPTILFWGWDWDHQSGFLGIDPNFQWACCPRWTFSDGGVNCFTPHSGYPFGPLWSPNGKKNVKVLFGLWGRTKTLGSFFLRTLRAIGGFLW